MPKDFGKRLKKIRTLLNLNQKTMGKQLEVPLTTISKYERGEIRPSSAFLERICIRLNTDINWLLTGTGSPFISQNNSRDDFTTRPVHLPLFDISRDFVKEDFSDKKNIIKYLCFNINWLISDPKIQPKNIFLIKLFDYSMFPFYNPGDIIFCDVSKKNEKADGLYLVAIGKKLYLRRIQHTQDKYMIIPDNVKYKTLFSNNTCSRIIAQAVWTSHVLHD